MVVGVAANKEELVIVYSVSCEIKSQGTKIIVTGSSPYYRVVTSAEYSKQKQIPIGKTLNKYHFHSAASSIWTQRDHHFYKCSIRHPTKQTTSNCESWWELTDAIHKGRMLTTSTSSVAANILWNLHKETQSHSWNQYCSDENMMRSPELSDC